MTINIIIGLLKKKNYDYDAYSNKGLIGVTFVASNNQTSFIHIQNTQYA